MFTGAEASAQTCKIIIDKVTDVPSNQVFFFDGFIGDELVLTGDLTANIPETVSQDVTVGETLSIVEQHSPGWAFGGVLCSSIVEYTIVENENGFDITCLNPGSAAGCTMTNVRVDEVRNIPTLSEWGMIAAAAGLALVGVFFAIRKRKERAV